ncbi:helix-turn-helix protein [Clostridium saccharobutylicum]|uniref:helix-turn-helix domain-containing protein n=1 Tax=Clostridium saccharobutylicum TaxID=169679 RepID=UPI00098C7B62|nr:helix-turn-helix transcriptional regulator [Clostridium saccharobutylicum]OOM17155.1 helix-turn-helix protein [Clostridium saccharobutylicum]
MKKLREIRENLGLRRDFVANKLGISPDYLSRLERGGARAKQSYIEKLSEIYRLPVDEIEDIAIITFERRKQSDRRTRKNIK